MHQSPTKETSRRRDRFASEIESEPVRIARPQAAKLRKFPLREEGERPGRNRPPGGRG